MKIVLIEDVAAEESNVHLHVNGIIISEGMERWWIHLLYMMEQRFNLRLGTITFMKLWIGG
uniref:Uncharacterized protein n=1 Tax=Romanomermis culicivorax TaxID=13658 RepID=A0A915JI96_ROMCU